MQTTLFFVPVVEAVRPATHLDPNIGRGSVTDSATDPDDNCLATVAVLCTRVPGHCEYDRDGTRHRQRRASIPAGNASRAPDVGRDVGDLPEETIERLGVGLMRLEEAMGEVREYFDLRPEDLNLDLGPLGPLLPREPG